MCRGVEGPGEGDFKSRKVIIYTWRTEINLEAPNQFFYPSITVDNAYILVQEPLYLSLVSITE